MQPGDWRKLRGALLGLGLALLAAALASAASYYFYREARAEFNHSKAQFEAERGRYLALGEQAALLTAHYPAFAALSRQGLVGPEQRLNWIETLGQAGPALGLPRLEYEIGARQALAADYGLDYGLDYELDHGSGHIAYRLYKSELRLSLGLLHEADLLRLFDYLDRHARGHYTVRTCRLQQPAGAIRIAPGAANLAADCRLEWLTLNLPDGGDMAP